MGKEPILALVGSGEYLPPMEPVDRFLLGCLGEPARVVCLPTAAGTEGAERVGYWSNLGVQHFSSLGAAVKAVPVIDRESAQEEGLAGQVAEANFVYFSGGKPDYLFRTLQGTRTWQAVQEVLARGGVLAGCSAGAMILGERIPGMLASTPGFGLLPGTTILPHFDEIGGRFGGVIRLLINQRLTLLGIEGNTALVKMDGHYSVAGSGGVTVWNKQHKRRYTAGETVIWP